MGDDDLVRRNMEFVAAELLGRQLTQQEAMSLQGIYLWATGSRADRAAEALSAVTGMCVEELKMSYLAGGR